MSASFSRSLRSLRADGAAPARTGILLAGALIGGWIAWLFLARVVRVETSQTARLEVGEAAHRIEAPASGKVIAVHLTLGAEVAVGEVLAELDDRSLQLELREKRTRRAAITAQIEPLRAEIAAHRQALGEAIEAGRAEVDEARALGREAEVAARFQEIEADRSAHLRGEGLASEADVARIAAEAQGKRAAADAHQLGTARATAEQKTRGSTLRADLARVGREATALEGEALALGAAIDGLLGAIERLRIVAPIAGRIGEIAALRAGAFVHEGDLVASIVPPGALKIVAAFPPSVVGRIRAGQPGRVRLDAFPFTEYGAVSVTVESIATEAQNGLIRVDLAVAPGAASGIPLEHGLPGVAIVEVERVSPATLLLRAAGQLGRTGGS